MQKKVGINTQICRPVKPKNGNRINGGVTFSNAAHNSCIHQLTL